MARRKEAHVAATVGLSLSRLMGPLVSFFVMLVAFSNQDARKMQAVTGSMRDAFGVQNDVHYSGVVESEASSAYQNQKRGAVNPEESSVTPTPDEKGEASHESEAFALAAASLRRALEGMPELAEASKHITIEESSEGLNIEIVDQDGISMFPEGSKEPYERPSIFYKRSPDRLRRLRTAFPSSGTRPAPKPGGQTMGRGICRPTGPTPCARSWRKKAIPRRMSTRWREKPIPNRCSPRTRRWHQIAASRSL